MLILVERTKDKKISQAKVEQTIRSSSNDVGQLNIGFPGGNFDQVIHTLGSGQLWAAFSPPNPETSIQRYWNGYGIYNPDRPAQTITVEINIPTDTNSAQVAGFFARDLATGVTYLMHSGRIGGGRKGIGKSAFLVWSKSELVDAIGADGEIRSGIAIGDIESTDLPGRIWRFVQNVAKFKDVAASGRLDDDDFKRQVEQFERYRREFSGRKRGSKRVSADYFTYHGDVVQALYDERNAITQYGETVSNNPLIDLFVRYNGIMTEIYEIKTNANRQSIYTAVGQLITHSGPDNPRKILVLPEGEDIAADFDVALTLLNVSVRRFRLAGRGKVKQIELLPEATKSR